MTIPMPLNIALQTCFPHGGVSISTMLKAIRQGNLNCSRLGRVYLVTADDIQDWMKSCRVKNRHDSISELACVAIPMSGTSKPQEQPTPDWAWEDDDAIDEDDEELEAEMNCGQFPGSGGCSMAGTEYCDWSCPFNRPTRRKSK